MTYNYMEIVRTPPYLRSPHATPKGSPVRLGAISPAEVAGKTHVLVGMSLLMLDLS